MQAIQVDMVLSVWSRLTAQGIILMSLATYLCHML
jgi:hypothetical protein